MAILHTVEFDIKGWLQRHRSPKKYFFACFTAVFVKKMKQIFAYSK